MSLSPIIFVIAMIYGKQFWKGKCDTIYSEKIFIDQSRTICAIQTNLPCTFHHLIAMAIWPLLSHHCILTLWLQKLLRVCHKSPAGVEKDTSSYMYSCAIKLCVRNVQSLPFIFLNLLYLIIYFCFFPKKKNWNVLTVVITCCKYILFSWFAQPRITMKISRSMVVGILN